MENVYTGTLSKIKADLCITIIDSYRSRSTSVAKRKVILIAISIAMSIGRDSLDCMGYSSLMNQPHLWTPKVRLIHETWATAGFNFETYHGLIMSTVQGMCRVCFQFV